jgi:hypothetical protein
MMATRAPDSGVDDKAPTGQHRHDLEQCFVSAFLRFGVTGAAFTETAENHTWQQPTQSATIQRLSLKNHGVHLGGKLLRKKVKSCLGAAAQHSQPHLICTHHFLQHGESLHQIIKVATIDFSNYIAAV